MTGSRSDDGGRSAGLPKRARNLLIGLVIAVVSVIIALLALEIVIRVAAPQRQFTCTVNAWDRVVGTKQMPGARGFVVVPEYAIDLIINSKGLRDREFSYRKPTGTRRILVLGDSFTCGYGVEAQDTYAKVLERLLDAGGVGGSRWEVLNAGVGSTGTANQLAFFETEGYKYEPDLVILGFFQNDFTDNLVSGLYTVEGDRLVKHDAPTTIWRRVQGVVCHLPGYNTLFARSHLLNFVKVRVARRHYRKLGVLYEQPGGDAEREAQTLAITEHLMSALAESCARHGCGLVVLMIPKIDYGEWPERTALLLDYLERQGIAFIDLAPAFRARDEAGVEVAYPEDHHWNRVGHELAAGILYDWIAAGAASTHQ